MAILLRTFDRDDFEARKQFIMGLTNDFNAKYGADTARTTITDSYYNMRDLIPPELVEITKNAFIAAGVEPLTVPMRGGTDGVMLSHSGLPCLNIFAGGHNFHGPYEFIPLESMEKAVNVVINLCKGEIAE